MPSNSSNAIYLPTSLGANAFKLKHNGSSIFAKEFNASSSSVVDLGNDYITIPNHFFKTGEKLEYVLPEVGSPLGITTTSPGNTLSTSILPSEVYPIVLDSNKIRLSLSRDLSLSGSYVDINSLGVGEEHKFVCEKQNAKCLVSLDNIIQSPVSIGNTVGIVSFINSTNISLESVEEIKNGSILKIGSEYVKVIGISFSEQNPSQGTVTVLRGEYILGTPSIDFNNTITYVTLISGNYNIVEDTIYFTDAPFEGSQFNYTIELDDIFNATDSFNLFNSNIKTGSIIRINAQNPPSNLISNQVYFAIKNYENNFSFAESYDDAVNGIKVEFDSTLGQYDPLSPVTPFVLTFLDFSNGTEFQGRAFLRSNYSGNNVFDDFSNSFNGISSSFELKSSGLSTSGITTDNGVVLINNLFQYPEFEESFIYEEQSGSTYLKFVGIGTTGDGYKDYDVNVRGLPRGGIIVGYGLSSGVNYQPLRGAILYETAKIQDGDNYIIDNSNVGIAYSGSGYRNTAGYAVSVYFTQEGERISGYGTATVDSGYITSISINENCTYTGIATPIITIDPPLSYENMEVSGSVSGIGAKVSLKISDSGGIDNFKFTNFGYGYKVGEVLSIDGIVGYSTQISSDELQIKIIEVGKDTFSAWNIGKLRKLDDLSSLANGNRKTFTIKENDQILSLESAVGSDIDLEQNILLFVNDVLQIPGESYAFGGGTQIILSEAPPAGSTIRVYFYMGSDEDSTLFDIDPKIKIGDNLKVKKNIERNPQTQFSRTVKRILSSDSLDTEIYTRKGLSYNSFTYRSVDFTPQSRDLYISGELISKSRDSLKTIDIAYSSIGSTTAQFNGIGTNILGINTTGLQVNDYIESDYTDSYQIVSIGSSEINLSHFATNASTGSYNVNIWRKI